MIGHTGQFFFGLVDLAAVALFPELGGAAAAFLSARFSLMVLADFLDAVWRGDLSVMICSCSGTEGFLTLNDTGTGLPRPWSRRADPSMRPDRERAAAAGWAEAMSSPAKISRVLCCPLSRC